MNPLSQTPSGIAYDRQGPDGGLPLVLIHAGIADRRMWDAQWQPLTAVRDTVRLDLRGFGESTRRPAGLLDHVADVVDTLGHLGIPRCHLVGASFGSGVAAEVALVRPDVVQSMLMCPPGGSLLAELTPDLKRFIDAEEAALTRGDIEAAVDANVASWVVGPGRSESDLEPAVVAAVRRMQRGVFEIAESWGDLGMVELEPPVNDRLADLDLPVLVLVGGHDLDTIGEASDRVCAGAPRVRRVDWPDVAHLPSMEKPQPFLQLLLEWIAAQD
jgi:3-oxoadipate enol-lactonase